MATKEFRQESCARLGCKRDRSETIADLIPHTSADSTLRPGPRPECSDNGPEFTATVVREWMARVGVKTLFLEPGSLWENGYIESFNRKLRDELPNGEIFFTLREARVVIEGWRLEYNHFRPHSSLGYRAPASLAVLRASAAHAPLRLPKLALQEGVGLR